jgi:membrane-bound lytic murein transglycosylase D
VNFKSLVNKLSSRSWKAFISMSFLLVFIGIIRLFTFSAKQEINDELYKKYFADNYKIFAVNIPADLNFAGEQVPLQDFEVRERIDREFLINTYWQSQTLLLIKRANRWLPLISSILKQHSIPEDFKYLAIVESGFAHGVSSKGAAGFWQFIPSTAQAYGLTINEEIDERYHVEKSTEAACKLFKDCYKSLGNWTLVAASFNIGLNGLQRQMNKQKATSYYDLLLNEETARYIFRVLAIKEIIKNPRQYGFIIRKKDLYPPILSQTIQVDSSITDMALFAEKAGINYKLLKYFNPWLRSDVLNNTEGKSYRVKIPHPSVKNYDELMRLAESETASPIMVSDSL